MNYRLYSSKAWGITKKYKWLWVYGLALVGAGSSTSSFNGSSLSHEESQDSSESVVKGASNVLGAATQSVENLFSNIQPSFWLYLVLGILLVVTLAVITRFILTSWATGGIISGIRVAQSGKTPTLASTTKYGIRVIKPLILFSVYKFLIMLGLVVAFAVAGVTAGSLLQDVGFVAALLIIALAIAGVVAILLLALITIFGHRFIVLEKVPAWDAFKKGYEAARKNFFPSLGVGILNTLIGMAASLAGIIVFGIVVAAPAYLLASPLFSASPMAPSALSIAALIVLGIVFLTGVTLVGAGVVVYKNAVWNIYFDELFTHKDEK